MIRRSKAAALAAFAMLCSLVIVSAEARREWQAFGGGGDAATKIECPAGQVMVGMEGRTGSWINAMRIVCAPLTGQFSTGAAEPFGGFFGGRPGGGQDQSRCPSDTVLTNIGFNLTPDKGKVVRIVLYCTRASGQQVNGVFGNYGAPDEGCGKALGILPKGCDPGEGERSQSCPQEQFVGLTVHSGRDVNAIGVICDRRDPPPPPPPPLKPIKTTGKARILSPAARPSGPPLAPRLTISGGWKMIAGEDHYTLVLTPQGQGIDPFGRDILQLGISGQIINADDPDDVGGLQGILEPSRTMTVNFGTQRGGGTCQLVYATDGQSLQGSCTRNGRSASWSGTRGSWPAAARSGGGRPAAGGDAAGGRSVTVKLDVDVYAQPGGEGQSIASLGAGTDGVTLVGACKGDWCHVRWGGGEGWVYSGSDYNSLGR